MSQTSSLLQHATSLSWLSRAVAFENIRLCPDTM